MFNDILHTPCPVRPACLCRHTIWLQCQYDRIKLCIYVWENGNMFLCWLLHASNDTTQRHFSKWGLFIHTQTHTGIQTKDRESRGRRVVEVCKDILYERVAVGGQHNLPRQLIYRLSCQVLIVIVRQYLHTSMCYCRQLLAIPRHPLPPGEHLTSQPAQRSHQASFTIS